MFARHATILGDRDNADALAMHKSPAPVADLSRLIGDVDNSLLYTQVRSLGSQFKIAHNLEPGRVILATGKRGRSCTGDFAFVRPAPEQVMAR